MSTYDDASLVMIPSGYKTGTVFSQKPMSTDGQLTFTRSNDTATRVASNGLIEKVRTNQVRNSTMVGASAPSTLPTNWVLNSAGLTFSVIGTGTEDGLTYIEVNATGTASSSNARIGFDSATQILGATGQYWTNSFYFKKVSETAAPDNYAMAIFENTSAGSLVVANVGSLPATTSLARYSYTVLTSGGATVARVQPFVRFSLTSGNSYNFTFRISATQMEQGDIATDYIVTTSAAVSVGPVANVPRLDYLGSSCPRLLLEPQRTNLALFSEQMNNAVWAQTRGTITANAIASPDGYTNADLWAQNSGETTAASLLQNISVTSGTVYSYSVFAKKQNKNFLGIRVNATSSTPSYFNLQNGTLGTINSLHTAKIEDYGNGWYRCTISYTTNSTSAGHIFYPTDGSSLTVTDSGGIYLWGAQLEAGAYATSYIPTLVAAVTRGADAASKTGISSLIGQTEGTLFVEFVNDGNSNSSIDRIISLSDGTANNRLYVARQSAGTPYFVSVTGGSVTGEITGGAALPQGAVKIAVAYKNNDVAMYVNGSLVGTDTSHTTPATSNLYLGQENAGTTSNLWKPYNQALLFKTRLSNSELASLTTL